MAVVKIDPDALYPEKETADLIRKKIDTLRRARCRGDGIPYIKYGRAIFYQGSDILAALRANRRRSTSDNAPGASP